jgi:IS5 family transposase
MISKQKQSSQVNFFLYLEDTLNPKHPLFILANRVDWQLFEDTFTPLYCANNGRPAKPIRLMVGLLILKHIRDISDESVVEQWTENLYYQYFCGLQQFSTDPPCASSELVHFRKRIGESGIELIFKESIRINGNDSNDDDVSVDTTVQEKNITFPTDSKLHKKIIKKCLAIAKKEKLTLRQTYTQTIKKLSVDQRFRNHPKNKGKAKKADKKMKTIAGRLVRELQRLLGLNSIYKFDFELFDSVIAQKRNSQNKIYSLHEPEVVCISKGKEHKKYEFGNKASFVITRNTGVLVGAKGFRNEFDGHTLEPALKQVEELTGRQPKTAAVDRGYRGNSEIGETKILIPKPFNDKKQTKYEQKKLRITHKKRAAIEPIIGHLKTDHRLGRNFYKGIIGDNINILMAAAAFNFKRMMNKWKISICQFFQTHFLEFQSIILKIITFIQLNIILKSNEISKKMGFLRLN